MQLELNNQELEVLRRVVEQKMDALLHQLSNADSLKFKQALKAEQDVLDGLFERLGCQRPEYSTERSCEIPQDDLETAGPNEVG